MDRACDYTVPLLVGSKTAIVCSEAGEGGQKLWRVRIWGFALTYHVFLSTYLQGLVGFMLRG